MKFIYDEQPLITGAMAVYPYKAGMESIFTIYPKFEEPFSIGFRRGEYFYAPRECVPLGKVDRRVKHEKRAINCKVQPRNDDQVKVIENSVKLLESGRNHVIDAPTGFGKSYCGAAIAARIGQPTLIIVTKEDLVVSWKKTLIDLIGVPPNQVGHVQADIEKWKGCRFVIGMIHSLVIQNKYPEEFFNYFGMVIWDECHRVAADTFSKSCSLFPAYYRLGLSATPNRSDGKWNVVQYNIGPVMVRGRIVPMKPKILVKKTGWRVPSVVRFDRNTGSYVKKKMDFTPGRMMGVYKAMGKDSTRNAIIAEFVKSSYASGRTTVVMADLIDGQLVPLFHAIANAGVPAEDIDFYIGGKSEMELDIASRKRVILATYKMCSEGTDKPWWDTLVLANPRSDVKQAIGRVMRYMEGKKTPVVLDLVDSDQIFSAFYHKRERQYYEVGATVVKLD